jgi:nicotinate-nucleotide adenylyltransferase
MDPVQQTGRRVAFFGGSFDPPHRGHLAVARAARAALRLDTVLFAPVGAQPLKPGGTGAEFADRVEMTRLAIEGEAGFGLSLADAPTPGGKPNYTLETLLRLRAELPEESALYCLMGADSYFGLRGWHRAAEIPFAAPLIVASRPGQRLDGLEAALPAGLTLEAAAEKEEAGAEMRRYFVVNGAGERTPFYLLAGLNVEISASAIREEMEAARGSETVEELLPGAVVEYIRAHGLYGGSR